MVNVGQSPPVIANASDSSSPPPTLTFSLLNAPPGATLIKTDSTNASFNWRTLVDNANTTNLIALKVADNAIPSLSATQSFLVTVNPLTLSTLSAPSWSNGLFSLQVTNGQKGPDYAVQASTNLLTWSTLWVTNLQSTDFTWQDTNAGAYPARFYRVQTGPTLP
jgi:hypothetical protein